MDVGFRAEPLGLPTSFFKHNRKNQQEKAPTSENIAGTKSKKNDKLTEPASLDDMISPQVGSLAAALGTAIDPATKASPIRQGSMDSTPSIADHVGLLVAAHRRHGNGTARFGNVGFAKWRHRLGHVVQRKLSKKHSEASYPHMNDWKAAPVK
jgi:hypothetical protein